MPRFFDDYSNTYLTHDSSAGRKQQRRGWKFRENFKLHYSTHIPAWRRSKMGLAAAQQSYIRSKNGAADAAIPPLPEGWKEEVDGVTGISYYIDPRTKARTWVRPGFIPPPPGGNSRVGGGGYHHSQQQRPPPSNYNRGPPPPMMPPHPFPSTTTTTTVPPPRGPPPPPMLGGVPPPQPQFFQPAPGQRMPPPQQPPGASAPPPPPLPNLPPPPPPQSFS